MATGWEGLVSANDDAIIELGSFHRENNRQFSIHNKEAAYQLK